MNTIALLTLLLLSPAAEPSAVEQCPTLPTGADVTWTYQQGPDFGVCYAVDSTSKKDAFGIYLGYHPSFNSQSAISAGSGKVGGHKVTWYKRKNTSDPSVFSRETLIDLDGKGTYAHLWVAATTETQLRHRLQILETMKFR